MLTSKTINFSTNSLQDRTIKCSKLSNIYSVYVCATRSSYKKISNTIRNTTPHLQIN